MKVTRDSIMMESLRLFRNGVDSVGLREIAQACGIKTPSLYNHFSSRDDLIRTLYIESYGMYGQALGNCIGVMNTVEDAKSALYRMIRCIFNLFDEDNDRFYFLIVNQFSLLKYVNEDSKNIVDYVRYYISCVKQIGCLKDSDIETLSMVIVGIVHGHSVGALYNKIQTPLEPHSDDIAKICWDAISK